MTLTAEQSSNKAKYEAAPTAEIIDIIRTAMGQGCIHPCHVYDAVDELICRMQALEHRPKRNCDVGTVEEQLKRLHNTICNTTKACPDPDWSCAKCFAVWSQTPYGEGGAK